MLCPNCNKTYDTIGNVCPHCNVDRVIFKRTSRLSAKLYNDGLAKLNASDFTHGIEALTKSVAIDKGNVKARNLLGLALFEVGHVGDAIKHWVISSSLESKNNPADDYLERVKKNSRTLEKFNDAVTMYNMALGHIRQKSDDLAIIQLKRAVENSPRFVDALNLLALCYLIQNDKERAISMVERVLSIDQANPIATKYYSTLNPGKSKNTRVVQPQVRQAAPPSSNSGPYKTISIQDKKPVNFHLAEILTFIFAVAATAAVFYFLLYPAIQQRHESDLARYMQRLANAEAAHEQAIQDIIAEKDELHIIISDRAETILELEQVTELQNRVQLANQAHWLYTNNQYQEAIDIIDYLDTTGFTFDIHERIDAIIAGSYPRLANSHFEAGRVAFQANDDHLALIHLELAWRFTTYDDWPTQVAPRDQRRDLMIMLGNLYYRDGRYEEAYEMIAPVRERFPNFTPRALSDLLASITANI